MAYLNEFELSDPITGEELVYVLQGGVSKKIRVDSLVPSGAVGGQTIHGSFEVGDVLVTIADPGVNWLQIEWQVYQKADYPELGAVWPSAAVYSGYHWLTNDSDVTGTNAGVAAFGYKEAMYILGLPTKDKLIRYHSDDLQVAGVYWVQDIITSVPGHSTAGAGATDTLILASAGDVYRSIDDGVSWTTISLGAIPASPANLVAGDPSGNWVISYGTEAWFSVDDGLSWTILPSLPDDFVGNIHSLVIEYNEDYPPDSAIRMAYTNDVAGSSIGEFYFAYPEDGWNYNAYPTTGNILLDASTDGVWCYAYVNSGTNQFVHAYSGNYDQDRITLPTPGLGLIDPGDPVALHMSPYTHVMVLITLKDGSYTRITMNPGSSFTDPFEWGVAPNWASTFQIQSAVIAKIPHLGKFNGTAAMSCTTSLITLNDSGSTVQFRFSERLEYNPPTEFSLRNAMEQAFEEPFKPWIRAKSDSDGAVGGGSPVVIGETYVSVVAYENTTYHYTFNMEELNGRFFRFKPNPNESRSDYTAAFYDPTEVLAEGFSFKIFNNTAATLELYFGSYSEVIFANIDSPNGNDSMVVGPNGVVTVKMLEQELYGTTTWLVWGDTLIMPGV